MSHKKRKKIIHVDMDDTIASFIGDERLTYVPIKPEHHHHQEMYRKEFFRKLKPIPGAIDSVNKLIDADLFDIYILSVPVHSSPHSYSEKVEWIHEHLPRLSSKIILTQDKSIIDGDYLIDDSIHWKEKWEKGNKKFIHFNPRGNLKSQWEEIIKYFFKKYKK